MFKTGSGLNRSGETMPLMWRNGRPGMQYTSPLAPTPPVVSRAGICRWTALKKSQMR